MMEKKKIVIASDHGGYDLKNELIKYLASQDFEIVDFGTYNKESCNYPYYAKKVAQAIIDGEFERGILVCGTGIGMQIAANRFKGIRAACPQNCYCARMSRAHNDSNILTLGQRVLGVDAAIEILNVWLNTEFEGGRHQERIDMLDE